MYTSTQEELSARRNDVSEIQPEQELPSIHLMIDNCSADITPENTSYTQYMLGKVAFGGILRSAGDFDHIRVQVTEFDEDDIWIFRPDGKRNPEAEEGFLELSRILLNHGYPIHANITEVDDEVIDAFRLKLESDAKEDSEELIDELTDFLLHNPDE